jgi:hypothetical protein
MQKEQTSMISSISGANQAGQVDNNQNAHAPHQKHAQDSKPPQDSVQLSAAALSSGDADHDGDSH